MTRSTRSVLTWSLLPCLGALVSVSSCADQDVDVSEPVEKGGVCDYLGDPADPETRVCADGYVCEPVAGAENYVCSTPLRIRGLIHDALDGLALPDAYITVLDQTGAPSSDVSVSAIDGSYELLVSAYRNEAGDIPNDAIYKLQVFAADYQPFPYGVRPALPIDTGDAKVETETFVDPDTDEERVVEYLVIDNPTTSVDMIPLPPSERGGATIFGNVGGVRPGGTLVVAEGGGAPAPYGIADLSGDYVVFNVPEGQTTVKGYRRGLELATASVNAGGVLTEVNLAAIAEDYEGLGAVSGTANIVNAPGGSVTSVVLVPSSVFNDIFELGPVPFGLRVPDPGLGPDVSGSFRFAGVPEGTYKVLAAFENDLLVRDPDTNIAGTAIQEVTVAPNQSVEVEENFKVTEALAVISPGADDPEEVSDNPTLVWADDSSEDFYELVVYNALGEVQLDVGDVPRVTGSATVEYVYDGMPLVPGMYYQFRVNSVKGDSPISRTEDLRGVFIAR
ncbi:MAG: hypothetical protein H6713_26055 [Myxococcales bacterium]|nr:hypothetical protein [Myxococcales bacterium]